MGKAAAWLINTVGLEYEGLYAVLTLASAFFMYGIAVVLGVNGFLAAYIAGLVIGNSAIVHKKSMIRFHQGIAWLMQITLFLTLGLFVFPSELMPVLVPGVILAFVLIFVALIGLEAGIIGQGVYVTLVLMSLLTTLITPIVYRNWFYRGEYCAYDAKGICIDEGK